MRNSLVKLLYLLVLIYPWGKFFDKLIFSFGALPGAKGISSLIILLIVILGILNKDFTNGFLKVPKKIFLLVFLALTLFATAFSNFPEKIFSDYVNLVVYFLLIFVIVGINPSFKEVIKLVKLLLFSTFLMASFSLLDYLNFINLPHFNEGISNVRVGNSIVFDLTGPFLIRTEIGYHLALITILPILFLFLKKQNFLSAFIYSFMLVILLITAYFSNTRSIFLSLAFCISYFVILKIKDLKGLKFISAIVLIFILLMSIVFNFVNDSNLFLRNVGNESDLTRYYAFTSTIIDIIEKPIGAGLDRPFIEEIGMHKDVHSSITYLLRAGGFIGFLCLIFFFSQLLKKIFSFKVSLKESIVVLPVISLLIFGFFHTSIQVPTFWVLTGIVFSINLYKEKYN